MKQNSKVNYNSIESQITSERDDNMRSHCEHIDSRLKANKNIDPIK